LCAQPYSILKRPLLDLLQTPWHGFGGVMGSAIGPWVRGPGCKQCGGHHPG
jgi:hypothetical protein